jgi:glucose/arabinose dehydrogenase
MANSIPHSRLVLAPFALAAVLASTALAQPTGFTRTVLAGGFRNPISLAHAPDGRIFVAEIGGAVKSVKGGVTTPVHTVSTNTDREQGLLKIEIHPKFAQNGWLYLYYLTSDRHHHNIDRITVDAANKVSDSKTLVQLVPLVNAGRHNGSGMVFGKDGYLYVGRGEDEQEHWASQWATQRGKILRFTEEGKPAPGNPHATAASAEEQSIWARGFRNPFYLTLDPTSGRIFEGDVGAADEEINDITKPDAAMDHWYGWGGGGDGPNQNANTIKPIFSYATGSLGCAITGIAAYNAPGSTWPAEWKNRIYWTDWCRGYIQAIDIANPTAAPTSFMATNASNAMGITVGVDGGLYHVGYNSGQLIRISNAPIPTAVEFEARRLSTLAGETDFLKMDGAGRIAGRLTGAPAGTQGTLTFYSAEGRRDGVHAVTFEASQITVSRPETLRSVLRPFRLEWRDPAGSLQVRQGRILLLP